MKFKLPPRKQHNIKDILKRAGASHVLHPNGSVLTNGSHIDKTPKYTVKLKDGSFQTKSVNVQKSTNLTTVVGAVPLLNFSIITPPLPSDIGSTKDYSSNTLFSYGSDDDRANDCTQWTIADCYFDAPLAMISIQCPWVRPYLVKSNPDATFDVLFQTTTRGKYIIRVNGLLGDVGCKPNPVTGAIWVPIMEKAYAYARNFQNTYDGLNWGSPGPVFNDLGFSALYFQPGGSNMLTVMLATLANNYPMCGCTASIIKNWPEGIPAHCYGIYDIYTVNGVTYIVLVNPWNFGGINNDGFVIVTLQQFNENFLSVAAVNNIPFAKPTKISGDATGDGRVDASDLNAIASHWQGVVQINTNGDVSGPSGIPDGKVDAFDLNTIASNWQKNISGVIQGQYPQ